jgi:DNA-binding NtrC family response regulator
MPNDQPEMLNQEGTKPLSVLVGIPDAEERAKVIALLRGEGHSVVEAADAHEMGARLDESDQGGFDAIVCAGLLSETNDPALAARLTKADKARALILLPAGGLLSTASRAQRLGASAVLPHSDRLLHLRELLYQRRASSGR